MGLLQPRVARVLGARRHLRVFRGEQLGGEVLELGCGAGANAAALLARYPDARVTATDVDPVMVDAARARLGRFGDRTSVHVADAAGLDFPDASFDAVVSFLMLHHVGDWQAALNEVARVLRPGGQFVGYDLTRSGHHATSADDLRAGLARVGFVEVRLDCRLGDLIARLGASGRKNP